MFFVVTVKIIAGEYEKRAVKLVEADSAAAAEKEAIEREAHHELEWDGEGAYDAMGQFHYSASSCKEVAPEDVVTLKKYL